MQLVLRSDLGGRAAELPVLQSLSGVRITKPFVLLVGGNGSGKSTLFSTLRQATGLVGPGIGNFADEGINDRPLSLPGRWSREPVAIDFARHAFLVHKDQFGWGDEARLPHDAVGVLDPVKLGWKGQRVWLHDGRNIDDRGKERYSMNLSAMRRSADDELRSHGQQLTGRLRYAIAWALGMFDIADPYDRPEPDKDSYRFKKEEVPREIFARLSGRRAGQPGRTDERWLLLDEPETGLDPVVFARLMATLAENARVGSTRVFCATHSALAMELSTHPNVQIIDMDGYRLRMKQARATLRDPEARAAVAMAEAEALSVDACAAIAFDRGIPGQGRFTAHEAQSVPYSDAIIAPYGKPELLARMHGTKVTGEETDEEMEAGAAPPRR